jgi:integrase
MYKSPSAEPVSNFGTGQHYHKYRLQQKTTLRLEGSAAYENMFYAINSKETVRNYRHGLMRYMQFLGVDDIDNLLLDSDKPVIIETKIMSFLRALRDDPKYNRVTFSTRQAYLYGILSFYKHNDIALRTERIASNLGGGLRRVHRDRGYTADEIRRMLEFTDVRTRALVLFLASTGCRIGAVPDLKLKHFKKINEYNLYQITVYENTNDQYETFCTSEARDAIDQYLAYRQQHGEKLTPNSPFMRNRFNIEQVQPSKVGRHIHPLKVKGVSELIHLILERSGILKEQQAKREHDLSEEGLQDQQQAGLHQGTVRHEVKMAHGFRKFYNLALINANVKNVTKEMLIGHKSSLKLDLNYYRPSDNELLQEYLKAVDLLTINNEKRLENEVTILKQKENEIEELKLAYKRDVETISAEMEAIRAMVTNESASSKRISEKTMMQGKAIANMEARMRNIEIPFPEISEEQGRELLKSE